jgi:hypothetical protein
MDYYEGLEDSPMVIEESLEDWVMYNCNKWRDHYEQTTRKSLMSTTGSGVVSGLVRTRHVTVSVLVLSHLHYNRLLSPP